MIKNISVTILTKNSERYLIDVLDSLLDFEEVVIYDNGSTDATLEILKKYTNIKLFEGSFFGFGKTHNLASSLAVNDWILSIDSDEILQADLATEIKSLCLNEDSVYAISRKNYFNGKWIKSCGWSPDFQYRLYNKAKTAFNEADVHEQIIVKDFNKVHLKNSLIHYSYETISDFLRKMQHYSELFAEQHVGEKNSSPGKALLHGGYAFFKSYFLKRGLLQGYEGFIISIYNASTAFYKYLKLYEKNAFKTRRCPDEKAKFLKSAALQKK